MVLPFILISLKKIVISFVPFQCYDKKAFGERTWSENRENFFEKPQNVKFVSLDF